MADVAVLRGISCHVLRADCKALTVEIFLLDVNEERNDVGKLLDEVQHDWDAQVDAFDNQ